MRRDQKKHLKQKKRDDKNTAQKRYAERVDRERRRRDQYPRVLIDLTHGDPEFVKIVRAASATIDFDNPELFNGAERDFYRLMRRHGLPHALHCLSENDGGIGLVRTSVVLLGYGSNLLAQIPEETRRNLMPYNDVFVDMIERDIILRFSSMLTARGAGGTVFYARHKPQVEFHGKNWNVAFSRHAIERMCERINPRYIDYGASGDIHALFANCVYFEPVILYNDQPAFIFYDRCDIPGFVRYATYVEGILGKNNVDPTKGRCYYRVGYCPVVFEGQFAKAKTFLYPGYKGTPEYGLVIKAPLSREEKDVLIQQATTQDATEVLINDNPQAIKWFHDNGVPQVVQMNRQVFTLYGRHPPSPS